MKIFFFNLNNCINRISNSLKVMSIHYRQFLKEFRRIDEDKIFIDSPKTIEKYFRDWIKNNNFPIAHAINEEDVSRIIEEERQKCIEARKVALTIIFKMDAKEFQTRVLDGTLPDFPRAIEGDKDYTAGLVRDTCHPHVLLTNEDFERNIVNYAEAHRYKLRFMEIDDFKSLCYNLY
jgi:hypothetical protein